MSKSDQSIFQAYTIKEFKDLDIYWQAKSYLLPKLSSLALMYIWLSVSDVDVKCSFSSYKSILSNRKVIFKEESIKMLTLIQIVILIMITN